MFSKLQKHSGIYHIKDNIDELEIELNFRHVHSLLKLPSYEITAKGLKFDGNETNNHEIDNEHSSTTVRVKWQQKLMSPREMELYKNIKNCITETHKKYNKLLNTTEENKSKKRVKKSTRHKSMTITTPRINEINEIFTYVQDDDFIPEEEKKLNENSERNSMKSVSMYIYAAINTETETQLVVLKWFAKERLLHIYPDFNDFNIDPYFIETNYRNLFAYAVINVSSSRLKPNREHNIIIKPQFQIERHLNGQFQMPPERSMTRFVLLFEINAACGFSMHEPMHVRYYLHLPEFCTLEEGLAEASTHASFATNTPYMCSISKGNYNNNNCYNYGYNFQLTLLCDNSLNPSAMLHIYFELISIDNWERERLEGYAHYSTYLTKAGKETQELMCLRPVDNLLAKLERYFIGGRRKFDYVQFFTPPKTAETLLHNRFECRMINCGHLHIICQKINQRNCELLLDSKNLCMTIDDILMAYTQARNRLESFIKKY